MTRLKRSRSAFVLVGVLGVVLVGLTMSGLAATQVTPDVTPQVVQDEGTCPADVAEQEVGPQAAPGGGNPCKDCPRKYGGHCTRISCDPCCYACLGEPLPICSS